MATEQKLVVVHSGQFHGDDIFAAATIAHYCGGLDKVHIVRTRDAEVQAKADFVMDTGEVYDPAKRRFDHHQPEGAGARANGIPYAAFGLVWKEYGVKVCEMLGAGEHAARVAEVIDRELVSPVDADDNGFSIADYKIPGVGHYRVQEFFYAARPTWKEIEEGTLDLDTQFLTQVPIAYALIAREVKIATDNLEGEARSLAAYEAVEDKRIVVLDGDYPWKEVLSAKPEPLFVVYKQYSMWRTATVQTPFTFKARKDLPAAWAGLRGEELAKVSGVPDALFCHRKLFTCGASSREGAIALAQKALEA